MRRVRYALVSRLDGFIAGPNNEFDWITDDPEFDSSQDFSLRQCAHRTARLQERNALPHLFVIY
jgi:hypothetical protein